MKKLIIPLIVLVIITGCTKEEPATEVTFTINVSGFYITTDDFGVMKSTNGVFDSFTHKYESGTINFTAQSGAVYKFNTNTSSLDGYSITLSAGSYQLTGESIVAQPIPISRMSFTIPEQAVEITEITTEIDINITPTCGLMLVADQSSQVKKAFLVGIRIIQNIRLLKKESFTTDILHHGALIMLM